MDGVTDKLTDKVDHYGPHRVKLGRSFQHFWRKPPKMDTILTIDTLCSNLWVSFIFNSQIQYTFNTVTPYQVHHTHLLFYPSHFVTNFIDPPPHRHDYINGWPLSFSLPALKQTVGFRISDSSVEPLPKYLEAIRFPYPKIYHRYSVMVRFS